MSDTKQDKSQVDEKNVEVVEEENSPWYYFYSNGCGFCKKVGPIVDELIKEGHDILKLDVADKDNQGLSQELKEKYKAQCGTPWFINSETGKQVCGFREKDVIKKWLDGEDIPAPPRPKGPMPKLPLFGAPDEEVEGWKAAYEVWKVENSHLPNLQTTDQILSRPRPKTDPPPPPNPNMTDEEMSTWGKLYNKWKDENDHLPNLQPVEKILERFKAQAQQPGGQQLPGGNITERLTFLEVKMDALMKHLGVPNPTPSQPVQPSSPIKVGENVKNLRPKTSKKNSGEGK